MLCTNNTSTEDKLVFLLAKKPHLCGPDLHQEYIEHFSSVSKQGMYKRLSIMKRKGLIVKTGRRYSLHLPWVLDMMDLVENIFESGFKKNNSKHFEFEDLEYKQWKFSSIEELFHIHANILISIIGISQNKNIIQYFPHYLFYLFYGEKWEKFLKKFSKETKHIYTIVGGQTQEDKKVFFRVKEKHEETMYLCSIDEQIVSNRSTYIHVIGDYIIRIMLDIEITKKIDLIYEQNIIKLSSVEEINKMKGKNYISIRKNPDKARIYKKKFVQFFGPIN